MENLRDYLEPIADIFRRMNIPEPIIHWGHPAMMAIVVFVLGTFVAYMGWRGRLSTQGEVAAESWKAHRTLAPWMYIFIALGYTGGVLSLVMQNQPIFESSHFWTGSTVLVLLTINAMLALFGFPGKKELLRTIHAYVGGTAILLLFVHAFLGLRLGLTL